MNSIVPASLNSASRDEYQNPANDIPAIRNTRYLSAAAHLRRSMLPDEITDSSSDASRPPLPVGRAYAIGVLFRHGSRIPMLAVDVGMIKKSCRIALLQTVVRDMMAIGVLAAGLIIEPWGMILTVGVVVAAIALTRRSRYFLAVILVGVVCVALALVNGSRSERISLGTPLGCLALCLLVYLADVWLSMCYVRRIWRRSAQQEKARMPSRSSPVGGAAPAGRARSATRKLLLRTPSRSEYRQWPHAGHLGDSGSSGSHDGSEHADNGNYGYDQEVSSSGTAYSAPAMGGPIRIYYAADEFVGSGTALRPLTLTVPLNKPQEASRDVDMFSVSELMAEVSGHLLSQGAGDIDAPGWAYQPLSTDEAGLSSHEPGHFTYGLPHLDVTEVEAIPAPDKDRWLGTPITVTRFDYRSPSRDDMPGLADGSPTVHLRRHYLRVMTTSWDGQLTATVFVNAALQGHFLRVIMRPYVLAPTVKDLGIADELVKWNPFFLACLAAQVTIRQFCTTTRKFSRAGNRRGKKTGPKPRRADLYSTREYYARPPHSSNMHQSEDTNRTIAIIQEKTFKVIMDFLKCHNVDVAEYEKQMQNIIYNNTVNGNITSGTFNNSQIASVSGQGNAASNVNAPMANGTPK